MPGSKQAGPSALAGISLLLWSNTLEQNTEQKFILSFPYKTLALASEARLQTNCKTIAVASTQPWAVPRRHLPFAFQGLLLHPALCQNSVPSPRGSPQAWFSGSSQSPSQLQVFCLLEVLFFGLSEQPR